MKIAGILACCLLAAMCPPLLSQQVRPDIQDLSTNQIIDDGTETITAFDPEQWSGIIPLDLNELDAYWFVRHGFINELQWQELRKHINRFGSLLSVYELQVIEGWDRSTIHSILDLIRVRDELEKPAADPGKWISRGKQMLSLYWQQPFQTRSGFRESEQSTRKYRGNTFRYQIAYRWQYENQFKAGIILDQDPGELISLRRPADHIGFHLQVAHPLPFIKNLFLGDYRISLGQGIAGFGGFAGGISDRVAGIRKTAPVVQVHRSSAETGFNRGMALDLELSPELDLQVWGFIQKADARLDTIVGIRTLLNTGLHRTSSEIRARKSIRKKGIGVRSGLWLQNMGFSVYCQLTKRIPVKDLPPSVLPYNDEAFYGSDHYLYLGPSTLFGEVVFDQSGNWSFLEGIQAGIGKKVSIGILYRHFHPNVTGEFGNPLSNQSSSQNEAGLLSVIEIMPNREWNLAFHLDQWKQLYSTERDPWPSSGYSYGARLNYNKRHDWEAMIIYKVKHREKAKSSGGEPIKKLSGEKSTRIRFYASKHIQKGVEWRIRAEFKNIDDGSENNRGTFLATDLIWKPIGSRWTFTGRIGIFDCPDYSARIYAYENNLVYRGHTAPYYRTGKRFYINTRYRPNTKLSLEGRIAITAYANTNEVGSGPDATQGNVRSDYAFQLRYRIK